MAPAFAFRYLKVLSRYANGDLRYPDNVLRYVAADFRYRLNDDRYARTGFRYRRDDLRYAKVSVLGSKGDLRYAKNDLCYMETAVSSSAGPTLAQKQHNAGGYYRRLKRMLKRQASQ